MGAQITVNYLFIAHVFTIKSDYRMRRASYDTIVEWARSILPKRDKLKDNFYAVKSIMKLLGLGYQKISMCPNFCILYYTENKDLTACITFGHARYKP
jgi:hypothetical protein